MAKERTEVGDPRAEKLREVADLIEEALFASLNRAMNGEAGEQKPARKAWRATAQSFAQFLEGDYESLKANRAREARDDDGLDVVGPSTT